jgi:DNA polymerase III subunit gamma/tau
MSFVVTARKWRPQRFEEVVGQEHITTTLKNAISQNRIAHAYIFTGPRGVGKTTTARILAKTLNCLNSTNFEPCNECETCKSIQNSQSMDIIEIDGASNRGIDEIRTLRDSVKYAPTSGKYKVYIIDEVHMLTKESFNAFLKTLEEPPSHIIFIFATTDIHKVPLTIISRCQRFDFRRIQLDVIKDLLNKIALAENIQIDDRTLTIIAKKADGALRDAESYFDQVVSFCGNKVDSETVIRMLNLIDDETYFVISDAVLNKDFRKAFEISGTIFTNGWSYIDFLDGLIEHFRNIMTVVLTGKTELIETADVYRGRYLDYQEQFSEGDILRLLNFLSRTQQELRYSQNQKLKIEIALTQLIALEKSETLSKLISGLGGGNSGEKAVNEPPAKKIVSNIPYTPKTDRNLKESVTISDNSLISQAYTSVSGNASVGISAAPAEFNIDAIVQKWVGFVQLINEERALTLGSLLNSSKVIGFENNRILISSADSHGPEAIKMHQDYLSKKAMNYFGRKLSLGCVQMEKEKSENQERSKEESDPYISAIMKELGGERIS